MIDIKLLAGITAGLLTGSVVTFFVTKRAFAKKLDEESKKLREYYKNYICKEEKPDRSNANVEKDKSVFGYTFTNTEEKPYTFVEKGEPEHANSLLDIESLHPSSLGTYESIAKNYANTPKNEVEEEKEVKKEPYVITPEQYSDDNSYDKVLLLYYEEDDVLTDEDQDIINDVYDTVGPDALNKFGLYAKDVVYVRNEKYGCDYEIDREHASYSEDVLGV